MSALLAFGLRNWKLLVGAVLLIAIGVQTLRLNASQRANEALRNEVAACEAARAVQNAAVERMAAEGRERQEAFERASSAAREAISEARRRSAPLRNLPANNCPTPSAVLEAPL